MSEHNPPGHTLPQLRTELRTARRAISPEEREEKSLRIARRLSKYLPFQRSQHIAVYLPMPDEVNTWPIIELATMQGKHLYLPVINTARWRRETMLFGQFLPGETVLRSNRFGIGEPVCPPGSHLKGTDLDMVCLPMVGFNEQCDRIGMGGGYYDKTFARPGIRRNRLVGLAFEAQKAGFKPEPHDVAMLAVVTEERILERDKSRP